MCKRATFSVSVMLFQINPRLIGVLQHIGLMQAKRQDVYQYRYGKRCEWEMANELIR